MCRELYKLPSSTMMEQIDQTLCPFDPRPVDQKERKRYQNRLAQRTYRQNQKRRIKRLEEAVERASKKSASPMSSENGDSAYLNPNMQGENFPLFPADGESQHQELQQQQQQQHYEHYRLQQQEQQHQPQYQQGMNFVPYKTASSLLLNELTEKIPLDSSQDLIMSPGTPSSLSRTALHRAIFNGSEQMIRLLIQRGADIRLQDSNGQTALHLASEIGREDAVRVLLESDNPNAVDALGRTPLFQAVRGGNEVIVKLLIDASIQVNHKDVMGETALHWAVDRGSEKLTNLLLEAGADIDG